MPTVTWNQAKWRDYEWDDGGDHWSAAWGGPSAQWLSCVHPRAGQFLPARSVVEIAPGYGRWTQFLLPQCESYVGVDLVERCVQACRERFADLPHARFATGDGRTLPMVPDRSVDLVFSFDSLVHAEADVIGSYLRECARVLSPDGVAFIHHSNVGAYRRTAAARDAIGQVVRVTSLFPLVKRAMVRLGVADWHGDRSRSVTAERFSDLAREVGLACPAQEVITWSSPLLTDCISVVARPGSQWDREPTRASNRAFHVASRSSLAASQAFAWPVTALAVVSDGGVTL